MDCHFLLQGIFLSQGSNLPVPLGRRLLSHQVRPSPIASTMLNQSIIPPPRLTSWWLWTWCLAPLWSSGYHKIALSGFFLAEWILFFDSLLCFVFFIPKFATGWHALGCAFGLSFPSFVHFLSQKFLLIHLYTLNIYTYFCINKVV